MNPPSTNIAVPVIFGFVTGEEQRHIGDVVRLAGTSDRLRLGQDLGASLGTGAGNWCVDPARADAIDADTILRQFDRRTLGEVDLRRLWRRG